LIAAVWTLFSRRTPLDAAIEIDRRFELRERVASSLSLSPDDQSSEAGRAVVNDALRAVSRIDVDEKFRIHLDRRAWWPIVPAAIAFVLVAFVDRRAESSIEPDSAANIEKQVKQSAESLRKKIEERTKQAREKGLKDAEGLFKQIEQGARELTEKQNIDRTKAAVKLNDVAKQLEERRQQLGGKDGLKEQLQNMKNLGAGPAERAAQAMKQGDWKKALQEVEKLAKDLRDGKLDAQAKEQLAKQLQQMKEKLEAAAQAHQQAMDDLKKQIEKQREQGNLAKAGELQEKLDKLKQQQPQMDRLQQMAQQLGQVQQGMEQGNPEQAADAMSQLAQQLGQMQQEMNELEMLDAALAELELAKDAMACAECQGGGCEACQGAGFGKNLEGEPGMGMGEGRGIGPRPDDKNATNLRDTRVRQKPRQGTAVFGGMVEGPNIKGEVAQSIKEEMATLSAEPADPLTSERLPKSRRQHAEQYFQMLREGK
jgi:DNA repair exonuclease SbcCD ATPase subunit